MSSSKVDPRDQSKVVAFHLPKAAEANDWTGNVAMYSSLGGMFLRNKFKFLPWVSAYFGMCSGLNTKNSERDTATGYSGTMLGFVALVTYYMNVYFTITRQVPAGNAEGTN
ncbi:hypothetical protein INT44_002848 [Umbelopsis vinacea]|uniref:Uncharacterized protein n=1 Tax=Umbelopsis vinacea TaxID=44442 RepID=A0A8H7UPV6_9FUNG|nr:hypothetical protein INT44_002848 [Umbelopsis vinacea]KAI9290198.1 hypothetical protein BC943DRAFT_313482 [Umbelopsis sp. AD052]